MLESFYLVSNIFQNFHLDFLILIIYKKYVIIKS